MTQDNNPLLQHFDTPFETPPFHLITPDHYMPAVQEGIRQAKEAVQQIIGHDAAPDFDNTVAALDFMDLLLSQVNSILTNQNSADTNPQIQEVVKEASAAISAHQNEVWQNAHLFDRVKEVYRQKEDLSLTEEQEILLDKTYKMFVRSGANLDKKDQDRLREISMKLSTLKLQFGEHVLAETNDYEMVIEDEAQLDGLPDAIKAQAAAVAKEKGHEGKWVFTLQAPSFLPFMENVRDRKLRETLFKAFSSRANKGNSHDNKTIIDQIVSLSAEKAALLSYDSFADYKLEERMAGSSDTVNGFLNDLLVKAKPLAEGEVGELKAYAKEKDGLDDLQRWDWAYYSDQLKKEKYAIDDELLRPYFKLENVLEGVFVTVEKLYGLTFVANDDIPVYHEEVKAYEVNDAEGRHVAVFYADFHPRASKRGGAWMTSYRHQMVENGENVRPHVAIVCNFTPSTEDQPSLLTFNEVLTLFHEFGHALHGMLANTTYPSLSGTGVFWDFVELPSQIFENWCYEKECLDLFARHYETGETIPQEYIDRIKASSTFQEAYRTMRQLSFGFLDMGWYTLSSEATKDATASIEAFEQAALASTNLLPKVDGSLISTQFSHIFAGGYSAGYYSYKWAEVLDADAFSLFKEKGIFNKEVATHFKDTVLSKGGAIHPMTLFKAFRGRAPKVDALLQRAGLG